MSKYIIELGDSAKKVVAIYLDEGAVWTGVQVVEDLEILNSDYINEHYGNLQDEAYQRGLEDGKAQSERGCEGCKYQANRELTCPCSECANSYKNHWTAKQTDDEIKVGDEVVWTEDEDIVIIVTLIYTSNGIEWCDGICRDGKVYQILTEHARKTGKRYDIEKILEEMKK